MCTCDTHLSFSRNTPRFGISGVSIPSFVTISKLLSLFFFFIHFLCAWTVWEGCVHVNVYVCV